MPPTCSDCGLPMAEGFIPDLGHHLLVMQARWVAGQPRASWTGSEVKNRQVEEGLKIVSYRCPGCGRLEHFAPGPQKGGN